MPVKDVLETIYTALHNDNDQIDAHIAVLKSTLAAAGAKTVEMDAARLPQNNRQGRKTLQAYFKKRGVAVTFAE